MANQWKGSKSPPWQKPGARQDRGKLQKAVIAAFEGKPAGTRLSAHAVIMACRGYAPTTRERSNRRRAILRAADRYCTRVPDDWGGFEYILKQDYWPPQ